MAALGGAFLSVGEVGNFRELMTGGRGFIALAAMILGNWNPVGAMWASLLFGFSEAFANQLQSSPLLHVSSNVKPLFNMFPFVVTLVVVAGFIGRTRPPRSEVNFSEEDTHYGTVDIRFTALCNGIDDRWWIHIWKHHGMESLGGIGRSKLQN